MRSAACAVLLCALVPAFAQPPAWVPLKGQVVFPNELPVPQQKALIIPAGLAAMPVLDESVIVNPKSRGIKNVVVWLRPDDPNDPKAAIDPKRFPPDDAKRKPTEHVIDQPCCAFEPHVLAVRVGDKLLVKNSAAIVHNFFWISENNGNFNANMPAGGNWNLPNPFAAESTPIKFSCTIHAWMSGYVRVFDHPFFAVTDADGKFEIKHAPVGKFRAVLWHENVGFKGGRSGRFGDVLDIKDKMPAHDVTWDVTK